MFHLSNLMSTVGKIPADAIYVSPLAPQAPKPMSAGFVREDLRCFPNWRRMHSAALIRRLDSMERESTRRKQLNDAWRKHRAEMRPSGLA